MNSNWGRCSQVTWQVIKDAMGGIMYDLSSMKFKNTFDSPKDKVQKEFDDLYESIQGAFRNLED